MNYTEDQTKYMVDEYTNKPTRITVERLAKELDKTPKSIIGKLSREGVYRRSVYKTKTGESPVTKVELVAELAAVSVPFCGRHFFRISSSTSVITFGFSLKKAFTFSLPWPIFLPL